MDQFYVDQQKRVQCIWHPNFLVDRHNGWMFYFNIFPYEYAYIYIYICMYLYTYVYVHVHVHVNVYVYVYVNVNVNVNVYVYVIKLIVNTKRKECHFLKILEPCSTKPRSQLWKPFPSEPVTSPWLKSKPPAQLPEPSPATGSSWMINCTHQNGMNFTYPKLQKFILDVCGNE